MSILMPDLTVEVYNADYRVLSRIPWQEAIRLILRGAVYVMDLHSPAVHIQSPSLVIELPLQWRCANTCTSRTRRSIGSPATGCFAATDTAVPTAASAPTPWITFCHVAGAAETPGSTWWPRASLATVSRGTGRRRKPG
jgi:hypothetical protein